MVPLLVNKVEDYEVDEGSLKMENILVMHYRHSWDDKSPDMLVGLECFAVHTLLYGFQILLQYTIWFFFHKSVHLFPWKLFWSFFEPFHKFPEAHWKFPWSSLQVFLKLLGSFLETFWKLSWSILEAFLKLIGNFPQASWKLSRSFLGAFPEASWRLSRSILEAFLKLLGNFS